MLTCQINFCPEDDGKKAGAVVPDESGGKTSCSPLKIERANLPASKWYAYPGHLILILHVVL